MLPGVTPYKIDVQQGNYVTQDMVAKLKPGMTRAQVRFALGTPLVIDPFRDDRWDYIYVYRKRGEVVEQRHMSVIFKGDQLVRIDGDVVPAPKPAAAAPKPAGATAAAAKPAVAAKPDETGGSKPDAGAATPGADKPAAAPEEKGFFGRMLEKLGF